LCGVHAAGELILQATGQLLYLGAVFLDDGAGHHLPQLALEAADLRGQRVGPQIGGKVLQRANQALDAPQEKLLCAGPQAAEDGKQQVGRRARDGDHALPEATEEGCDALPVVDDDVCGAGDGGHGSDHTGYG
jgi:uncharacterized protein YciI